MRVLVTGAMGHVGFAVVRALVRAGHSVVAQVRTTFRAEDAAALGGAVEWVESPLGGVADVAALVAGRGIEACVHCAAISNEAYAKPAPGDAVAANVGLTAGLLEAARAEGWRRFLLVSTGSVFQLRADTVAPIGEDAVPEPGGVYSTTKAAAELLVGMYRRNYGVSAASVRISWVYGPPVLSRSPTRGPIPSFLIRALRGEAIREGGADFAASFTFVEDVADGLVAAVDAPELRHAMYHLGHGRNFSAGEVADAVRSAVPGAVVELSGGTEPWTRFTALRGPLAGTRFAEDTGFAPRVSLAEGVAAYAAWLRRPGVRLPGPD